MLWKLYASNSPLVTLGTILFYIVFTIAVTEWRTKYRRQMNERDTEASHGPSTLRCSISKPSNISAMSEHESARFDRALQSYEKAAVNSKIAVRR